MNFCRTFRNTTLTEIGKIYIVRGRKFFLSFPAHYTCVSFCVLLSHGFSRLSIGHTFYGFINDNSIHLAKCAQHFVLQALKDNFLFSHNHRQKCWEGYQFLPFFYLSPPPLDQCWTKLKWFLCVIVVTCPNIE